METREQTPNLAKAVIAVMKAVKGIEKSMTVGAGTQSAYQGVPDKEVKKIIGEAMENAGLCILPIGVDAKTVIERWEETNQYGTKMKQSVFTEAKTKYLLLHESGESQVLEGYGHGIDSQDKGAGKSTTYALKYCLLYSFLVPTGKIDDADNTHSDEMETPQTGTATKQPELPWLNEKDTEAWGKIVTALKGGYEMRQVRLKYRVSKENEKKLAEQAGLVTTANA